MPSAPTTHFSPPQDDLSTLPAHLFQPLSMTLTAARDSNETLVDPSHQHATSLDPFNSFASSVSSPSTRYSFGVDNQDTKLTVSEASNGEPVLAVKVMTDGGNERTLETSEVWEVFDDNCQITRLTAKSLFTKEGGEIEWSRLYKTSWLSRRSSWLGVGGKRFSWEEPARNAKPCEIKLFDTQTKGVVASVRLDTSGQPRFLTVANDALPSLNMIFITFLHRMLRQAVSQRHKEQRNLQSEEENEMLAW
ncbi:hypothetical protein JCM3765_004933 [Sporobolomyces pararoseus]